MKLGRILCAPFSCADKHPSTSLAGMTGFSHWQRENTYAVAEHSQIECVCVSTLTGTNDSGESEILQAHMPLIGLTSEVDTPDWADKGVHSMTWWLSHGVHIQKANSGVGHCSSLSNDSEKQHHSMKKAEHQIVGALLPISCGPYVHLCLCAGCSEHIIYHVEI